MINLLNIIKSISYAYNLNSYPFLNVHQAMKAFYASYQHTRTPCDSSMESIRNLRNIIVHYGWGNGGTPIPSKKQ